MPPNELLRAEAWERLDGAGPLVISCEHASNRVPAPLRPGPGDRAWMGTHWGWDIGARSFSLELARQLGGSALLARFSRLVCDANRPPEHPDLIRAEIEGQPLRFNRHLGPQELQRRLDLYHHPYHHELDRLTAATVARERRCLLLSVHSFTPVWGVDLRSTEIGVLFDDHEDQARLLARQIRRLGFDASLNEPYSGKAGLIYAAARHGRAHGLLHLELELNQALVPTPARARRLARRLAPAFAALLPLTPPG
jgi:predicted N-formylglutamate amidohydrolase